MVSNREGGERKKPIISQKGAVNDDDNGNMFVSISSTDTVTYPLRLFYVSSIDASTL